MSTSPLKASRHSLTIDESHYANSDWRLELSPEEQLSRSGQGPGSLLARLYSFIPAGLKSRKYGDHVYEYRAAPSDESRDETPKNQPFREVGTDTRPKRSKLLKRVVLRLILFVLIAFGILHILLVILARKSMFWDVANSEVYLPDWGQPGHLGEGLAEYPTDATRDVLPIPCHSHNDYWRRIPLFEAIHHGCTSVEADVWLSKSRVDLLVGHGRSSLTPRRTFTSLYVNPLVELLNKMNPSTEFGNVTDHGVFDEDPEQTLVLLVDFKTNGHELFPYVQKQLEPLRSRDYLSYWNGDKFISRAVTVVGSGNIPFDLVVKDKKHRDIFFDAPLHEMWEPPLRSPGGVNAGELSEERAGNDFDPSNSYYASTSLMAHIGLPETGRLSSTQLDLIRGQIRGAKRKGLKVRYWETPAWPTSLRNHFWKLLWQEGADVINVDDLQAAAKMDWDIVKHDWFDA